MVEVSLEIPGCERNPQVAHGSLLSVAVMAQRRNSRT